MTSCDAYKFRLTGILVVLASTTACFDSLFEDGAPLTASWVLCCESGEVNTCLCAKAESCQERIFACPGGMCSSTAVCPSQPGGADGGAVDGGTVDGGSPTLDAGTLSFEFCCFNGWITTCSCPSSNCEGTFTPGPKGTCGPD